MLKLKVPRVDVSLKIIAVFFCIIFIGYTYSGAFLYSLVNYSFYSFCYSFFLNRKVFGKKTIDAIIYNSVGTIFGYLCFDERQ